MNYIIYQKSLNKDDLMRKNIVIDDLAEIAIGVKLYPNVSIVGKCRIDEGCEIFSNSSIEDSYLHSGVVVKSSVLNCVEVGDRTTVGPFANLHSSSVIGRDCRIGNFVEIKKSKLGDKCKVAHLTYIGDAEIGFNCNIGCGVVFCNYNGEIKQMSYLGDDVFVGSNVNIVAPVNIADNTYVCAGTTVTKDTQIGDFVIGRVRQENKNREK